MNRPTTPGPFKAATAPADAQDVGRRGGAAGTGPHGAAPPAAPEHPLERVLPRPAPQPGDLDAARALHQRSRRRAQDRAAAAGGTSVGVRLTRALGLVLALLLLVGASGAGGLLATGSSRARETQLRGLEAANASLRLTLAEADAAVREHRDTHLPQSLQTYRRSVQALPALRARVEDSLTDPLQRSLFDEQSRLADDWLRVSDPDRGAADLAGAATEARAFAALRDAGTRLDDLVHRQRHQATSTETWVRYGALTVSTLTLAAALAVVAGTGARTRRALVDPLRSLVDVLDAHGRGDRSAHADPAAGPAEVRSVALAVNDLARENARLLQAAERSARLHRLAGDIGRQVRDQLVAEDALRVAVTRLGQELRVGRVWVRMLQDGATPDRSGPRAGLGPVAGEWTAPGTAPLGAPGPDGGALRAFDDARDWLHALHAAGEVYAVPDTRTLHGRSPLLDGFLRGTGARALLLVPVGVGDVPQGLLSIACGTGPREWTVEEVELARSVVADLSRALVLAGLYRAQERLLGELRDVETVKSDLLATVSHELRTPLTSISGYLELLRDGAVGEVGEDVAAVLGVVERNTERLRSLIEDLLLLSRVESAPAARARGATAVAGLLDGVLAAARTGPAGGSTVRCTTAAEELDGLHVAGEAEHLHRALLAVVDNAVKFSPAGSLVRVRVERHPREVRVVVQDNGMGIPAADLAGVFDRFARGSNAALQQVPGTGLGLTVARDLLRLHGGRVELDSVEDRGTTATVRLPLAPATPASPAPASPAGPAAPAPAAGRTAAGAW